MTPSDRIRRARAAWRWNGSERPPFAAVLSAGQESVWDYPRPPRLEADSRRVVVRAGDVVIADTVSAVRVLETASAPSFYLPPADVSRELLEGETGSSFCEWKGGARYWTVVSPEGRLEGAAWSYPEPAPEFESIRGYLSFYPRVLECSVAGERVRPQPGGFYGGWVTSDICGPIKGDPGTHGW